MALYIIISLALLCIAGLPMYFYREDLKNFNGGTCPRCGHGLVKTHTNHNGRLWVCPKCRYRTWIYYETVDKHHPDDII